MNGLQLNAWLIGKKIGDGTCGTVFEAKPTIQLEHRCELTKQFVIKVVNLPVKPKGKKGMKEYKDDMRRVDTLYSEYMVYNKLHGLEGIPYVPIRGYGESQGYRYLVVERLDKSLADIVQEGVVSCKVAALYGSAMINILRSIHSKNVLYADMKPENIMTSSSKLYLIDFGITSQYMTARGEHKLLSQSNQIIGTSRFVSLNCHQGISNSRRDDIESLLYVLIYAIKGSLPWDMAKSTKEELEIKKSISVNELCYSLPLEWELMLGAIRKCEFGERPDYSFFEQQFMKMYLG